MTAFLAELGTKVADRWLGLLVLPGLLWTAALAAGVELGQDRALDVLRLRALLGRVADDPASHSGATVLLAAAAVLLVSAAAGLAASALGGLFQRLWTLPGEFGPAAWLLSWRQLRWDRATVLLRTAIAGAAQPGAHRLEPGEASRLARRAQRRRARLGPVRPGRPTRVGDRYLATAQRVRDHNRLDLELAWPRLWAVLPEAFRSDLTTAQDAYAGTARLAGWGVLYLVLAAVWWPAALVGATVLLASAVRTRGCADALAGRVEAAVDLYTGELATRLGLPAVPGTAELGRAVNNRLGVPAPPPVPPPQQ